MQVPEERLELELETERESARETERQTKNGIQFESEVKPKQSSRSDSSRAGVETLLRLKNANSHDLIIAV